MQPAGVLDVMNLPPNARAMTKAGRAYNKAAEELHMHLKRRLYLLEEYKKSISAQSGLMEELVRSHTRIDQILDEMSPAETHPTNE